MKIPWTLIKATLLTLVAVWLLASIGVLIGAQPIPL